MIAQTPLVKRNRSSRGAPSTVGDVVDAVMHFTADSREAAVVIDDLFATGRIRVVSPVGRREGPVVGVR